MKTFPANIGSFLDQFKPFKSFFLHLIKIDQGDPLTFSRTHPPCLVIDARVQEYSCTNVKLYKCTVVQVYSCTSVQLYKCTVEQVHSCTVEQV